MTRLAILVICLLASLAGGARAQPQSDSSDSAGGAASDQQASAESRRSLKELRKALVAAEDEIYAIFNRLNSDDDYDIICRKEKRIDTHFSTRVCQARILRELTSDEARRWADGDGFYSARQDSAYHEQVLRQKMRNLAAAHPPLRAALARHRDLKRAHDALLAENER